MPAFSWNGKIGIAFAQFESETWREKQLTSSDICGKLCFLFQRQHFLRFSHLFSPSYRNVNMQQFLGFYSQLTVYALILCVNFVSLDGKDNTYP